MYCRQQNLSVSACVSTLISTEDKKGLIWKMKVLKVE